MSNATAAFSLYQLSRYLYSYYGKKVIILIDEYDTPMQEAFVNGYWDELLCFANSLLISTFKANKYLERGILTGITAMPTDAVFSSLNNLRVVTVTSKEYADSFGFTEQEVFHALEEFGLEEHAVGVKEWYGGFRFGGRDDMFNPWSVINFIREKEFAPYWTETSSGGLADRLIRKGYSGIKLTVGDILNRETVHTHVTTEIVLDQICHPDEVWGFLLAAGYLKAENCSYSEEFGDTVYDLVIPNKEAEVTFCNLINGWFKNCTTAFNDFIQALLTGDSRAMTVQINEMAITTLSDFCSETDYFDYVGSVSFYHGLVLGLVVNLSDKYTIISQKESYSERYDVVLEPKSGSGGGYDGIILEFRIRSSDKEQTLQDTVKRALTQLVEKGYVFELETKGVPADRVRIYGFAFGGSG